MTFRFTSRPLRDSEATPREGDRIPNMKRAYELALVLRIEPGGDDAINEQIGNVQAWVEADELGQVTKIDRWGRRRLAYEIDRQRDGYYVILEAGIDPAGLPAIERNLKLTAAILRYLIVRADED